MMQTSYQIRDDHYVYIRTKRLDDRIISAEHVLPSKLGAPWVTEENRQQFVEELRLASEIVDRLLQQQEDAVKEEPESKKVVRRKKRGPPKIKKEPSYIEMLQEAA